MSAQVLAVAGLVLLTAGFVMAFWAIRRRPAQWRRMKWKAVAATPGTHEGVAAAGLALTVVGVVLLAVARLR
jgi:uncharacterized protein YjeT (DUF2065 family)